MLLELTPKPSKQLQYFIMFTHLGAIISVLFLTISVIAKIVLIVLCLYSYYYTYNKYIKLNHKSSVKTIKNNGDKTWQLTFRNNKSSEARLLGNSVLTSYMTLLNFQHHKTKKRISVVLLKDSLSNDQYSDLTRHLFTSTKDSVQ